MKYTVVLPYAYQPYFDECIKTCKFPRENMLLVDNTVENMGIMKAHNLGVKKMYEDGADWLIILSAAVRFGEPGGLDFVKVLEDHPDHSVIHGASLNVEGGKQSNPNGGGGVNKIFGWHLTAFHRRVFDAIGVWDENFTPYGLDDIDLSLRIRKGIPGVLWDTFPCDAADTTMSHSINLAHVKSAYPPRNDYFVRKWGREGGEWQNDGYPTPFNDPEKPLSYWPEPGDPLSIHEVEFKKGEFTFHD